MSVNLCDCSLITALVGDIPFATAAGYKQKRWYWDPGIRDPEA